VLARASRHGYRHLFHNFFSDTASSKSLPTLFGAAQLKFSAKSVRLKKSLLTIGLKFKA